MPGLDPGIHRKKRFIEKDGLPGHKRVHARLRRAMPGNDGSAQAARADRVDYDCPNSDAGSTLTPGPMVDEMAARVMKAPLAPAGRAFRTASGGALMLSTRWTTGDDALRVP